MSLAGPAMTLAFLLTLCLPFMLGLHQRAIAGMENHFWAGLAMLAICRRCRWCSTCCRCQDSTDSARWRR
ncbi:MAG: hypothetical protein HZY79_10390 [Rhodoblastus sp.]|nr:MAG: hypothetical protein HZY79_10390 [Rhodoblastus sp.]